MNSTHLRVVTVLSAAKAAISAARVRASTVQPAIRTVVELLDSSLVTTTAGCFPEAASARTTETGKAAAAAR